jgi:hypothetical protein
LRWTRSPCSRTRCRRWTVTWGPPSSRLNRWHTYFILWGVLFRENGSTKLNSKSVLGHSYILNSWQLKNNISITMGSVPGKWVDII